MTKTIKSIIGILASLCMILVYFIYLQIPSQTYKLQDVPKLLTKNVKGGEEIKWQSNVCKLHDKDYRTERVLQNLDTKREFPLNVTTSKSTAPPLKKGECRVSEVSQLVPLDQPPGNYELIIRIFVKSNKYHEDKFEYKLIGINVSTQN